MTDRFSQHTFSSSSALPGASRHRLPTLSASQALSAQQLQKAEVSTGSCTLNSILGDGPSAGSRFNRRYTKRLVPYTGIGDVEGKGGIPKGKLTEVCGPPGSGKTTFGIQVAANALLTGEKVTWIETAQPLPISRLIHLLEHQSDKDPFATLNSLRIIQCPTLAHLLALILYPPPPTATYCFPEKDTGVLVIDNISTPFSIAFPPGVDAHVLAKKGGKGTGASDGKAQVPSSVRRFSIMTDLAVGLGKLAAIKNIVILVLNQLTTRIIPGVGAVLQPAVGSPNWSNAFMNRLLIYRHDVPSHKLKFPEKAKSVRYVSILKASNVSYENGDGPIVSITVGDHGIGDVEYTPGWDPNSNSALPSRCQTPTPAATQTSVTTEAPSRTPEPHTLLVIQSLTTAVRESSAPMHSAPGTPPPPHSPRPEAGSAHVARRISLPILPESPHRRGKRKREIADSEDGRDDDVLAWADEIDSLAQFGVKGLDAFDVLGGHVDAQDDKYADT